MKKMISAMLAGAMAIGLVACGSSGSKGGFADNTIKIGGIGPLTGSAATYGIATKNGAEVAVEEINALGGLQFSLDFQDDTGVAETAVNAYNTLKDNGMQILYGCTTSDPSVNVAAETNADRVFQITPSASSTSVTKGRDNVFQVCFTDPNQGATAAQYIKDQSLGTKVAIIYNNSDPYSTGLTNAFTDKAKEVGLDVVASESFPDDSNSDFSAQLNSAKSAGADMVFLPIYYTPASTILRQAKEMGFAPKFFGCDGMDGILTMDGFDKTLAEGLMLMTPFNASATDDKTVSFVAKYKKAYNEEPNQFAADGYDAMYALYSACQKAGITTDMDAQSICEKLIATFTDASFKVDGLTGTGMTWSTKGEVSKEPVAVVIKDGAYVTM